MKQMLFTFVAMLSLQAQASILLQTNIAYTIDGKNAPAKALATQELSKLFTDKANIFCAQQNKAVALGTISLPGYKTDTYGTCPSNDPNPNNDIALPPPRNCAENTKQWHTTVSALASAELSCQGDAAAASVRLHTEKNLTLTAGVLDRVNMNHVLNFIHSTGHGKHYLWSLEKMASCSSVANAGGTREGDVCLRLNLNTDNGAEAATESTILIGFDYLRGLLSDQNNPMAQIILVNAENRAIAKTDMFGNFRPTGENQ